MDHAYIEDNQIVDRYLMGRLPEDEAERFADHSLGCQRCLDDLALAERMQRGMRRAAVEDAYRGALLAWWARAGALRWAALAVAAAVVALPFWLVLRGPGDAAGNGPLANAAVMRLSPLRGPDDRAPAARLSLPERPAMQVFALEVDGVSADLLRVSLIRGEETLWRSDEATLNAADEVMISVPTAYLDSGEYRFRVDQTQADGQWRTIAEFPFRAQRP